MSERFGFLTVLETFKGSDKPWDIRCRCVCDCGREVIVNRGNLRAGRTKSCGCMTNELKRNANRKKNIFKVEGDIVVGITTNTGHEFYVDADDLPLIENVSWHETNHGYIAHKDSGKPIQTLHRLVMGNPKDVVIDHINHNTRDNRKSNLRTCSQAENMRNMGRIPNGITKIKRGKRFYYVVQLHGYRGCFRTYDEAKLLRDKIIEEEYL